MLSVKDRQGIALLVGVAVVLGAILIISAVTVKPKPGPDNCPDEVTQSTVIVIDRSEGVGEQTIAEIECLERIFTLADTRPLSLSDLAAANRRHDEMLAHSPWFRLWQRYGVCCRTEPPVLRLGEIES